MANLSDFLRLGYSRKSRGVAQFGSALDWGSSGRRFKSCRPDHCFRQRGLHSKYLQRNLKTPQNRKISGFRPFAAPPYGRLDLTQSQRNDDKHDGICQRYVCWRVYREKRNTILVRSKALCGSLRRWVCCYETDRNISETNFMYC